jgi:hypothetical protein
VPFVLALNASCLIILIIIVANKKAPTSPAFEVDRAPKVVRNDDLRKEVFRSIASSFGELEPIHNLTFIPVIVKLNYCYDR